MGVDKQTAGIIPYEVIQKTLGSVTIFDFGGDRVFHAGHDVVLSNSIANSPSIIIVMVDLRDESNLFQESLIYWLEFVRNRCTERGPHPHLFLVASHANQAKDVPEKSQIMKSFVNSSQTDGFTYAGQVILDCRFSESPQMTELYTMLAQSCRTLRSSQGLDFDSHYFFMFLLNKFKDKPALTLGTAVAKVTEDSRDEIYWTFLKSRNLFEICERLNERGHILFMQNNSNPDNSWIILKKPVFLTCIFGTIFAPKGYKLHHRIATSMGVVPHSNLKNLFPKFDSDMLTRFLCHTGLCHEIDHRFLPCLQADDILWSSSERCFFFPGLVELTRPSDLWKSDSELNCCSGWVLQYSSPGHVFSSRFIQILLLRLFDLASSNLYQQSSCCIWKNGISWTSDGVDTIVEVVDRKTVKFSQRCKLSDELTMVHSRAIVIQKILAVKEEACPRLSVREFVVSPADSCHYPFDLSKAKSVTIEQLAQAVADGESSVSINDSDTIELDSLLQFEPYACLGKPVLQELFTATDNEVTAQFLHRFVNSVQCNVAEFKALMNQSLSLQHHKGYQCSSVGSNNQDLFEMFQTWCLSGQRKSVQGLRDVLDQFSIFVGRNIFEF